jgi:hypothetical protein
LERRSSRRNAGWFRKGPDERRHMLTPEERRRGGLNCAKKFTCHGWWHPDWWDRCRARKKGEY